ILVCASIRERIDRRDGEPVRVQVAELQSLLKNNAAPIPSAAERDMVMTHQPSSLTRQSIVMLLIERIRDQSRAFLARLIFFESLSDATPKRKWFRCRVPRRRKSPISRGRERRNIGRA